LQAFGYYWEREIRVEGSAEYHEPGVDLDTLLPNSFKGDSVQVEPFQELSVFFLLVVLKAWVNSFLSKLNFTSRVDFVFLVFDRHSDQEDNSTNVKETNSNHHVEAVRVLDLDDHREPVVV
jgi:hypothetical protein